MKSQLRSLFMVVTTGCLFLMFFGISDAGINVPWSSTFNCADQIPIYGSSTLGCDNLNVAHYAQTCEGISGPDYSEISSGGNNPLGSGKGFRLATSDTRNSLAANPEIFFNTPQREFWVRWHQRWPSGAGLSSSGDGIKLVYYSLVGQGLAGYVAMHSGDMQLYTQSGGTQHESYKTTVGSNAMWGGAWGDNKWHTIEMHFKSSSSFSALDGLWEVWVDGVKTGSFTGVDFFANFTMLAIPANEQITTNPANICVFIDYDDYAISNSGYIGPGTPGVATRPNPPSRLTAN